MKETIDYIQNKIKTFKPKLGIILGSGLGDFADNIEGVRIKYSDIPGFETSTVAGHKGQLVFGEVFGKNTVIMQGRYHFYEGYNVKDVVYPIKILKLLGVKSLIITNAAGGLNTDFEKGSLMLIEDHINFTAQNPLIGANDETLGERFPDMGEIYSKDLIKLAKKVSEKLGIKLEQGVYIGVTGPSYETPSEVRMFKMLGASAVGMSTVNEAIYANYLGLKILGISCITNFASGLSREKLTHKDVVETANKVKSDFKNLIKEIVKEL